MLGGGPSRELLLLLPQDRAYPWSFAWSPDKKLLAVGLADGELVIWNFHKIHLRNQRRLLLNRLFSGVLHHILLDSGEGGDEGLLRGVVFERWLGVREAVAVGRTGAKTGADAKEIGQVVGIDAFEFESGQLRDVPPFGKNRWTGEYELLAVTER